MLQAEEAQCLQPLFTVQVLQPHLDGALLNPLQLVNAFLVVGGPKRDTVHLYIPD